MANIILKMAFLPLAIIAASEHAHDMNETLKVSLFARLETKPGMEEAVAAFLKQGLDLANQEKTTPIWFALRLGPTTFAIFDAFKTEADRQAHLNGPIAKALMAQAPNLLAAPPVIEQLEILGAKIS